MELRHLRYFTAVAAHGTFRRAATVLHLTQPALSRQVRDLEEELGVTLIKRGKNFATLTDAGELFYEEAQEVLARAALAVERVRGVKQVEVLRVGYGPTLTAGIMPGALERFQAGEPRVRIELCDLSPREMSELAAKHELDLLIVPGDGKAVAADFRWADLRRLSHVLILPASHPLARLKKIPPRRLGGVPLIGLGRENFPGYAESMRALLKPFGVRPQFIKMLNDGVSAMFAELEASHAAAILADGIVNTMPRTLVARPFSPAFPSVLIQVGVPAVATNPHAETFARLLREEAARGKSR
ncbi:MAG TPA: LysR substrate-binding domain-containing protein [Opitutaceae bacterium]|nr:LysR substrate-binding domain-containing protein [Opitutaceae bacterium]